MSMRKKIIALIIALVIVIAGLYVIPFEVMAGDSKCIASGCNYVRARGSMYCNTHTCRYTTWKYDKEMAETIIAENEEYIEKAFKDGLTAGLRIPILREGRSHPDKGNA